MDHCNPPAHRCGSVKCILVPPGLPRGRLAPRLAHRGVIGPAHNGTTEVDYGVREGQMQTRRLPANAGNRLK